MKTRFSYDGILYSFSHNKTRPLRMFPEKVDLPKKIYEKQNPKLYKTLYPSMMIDVYKSHVERGELLIKVSSVLFSKQNCIRKVKVRYLACLVR